MCNRTVEKTVFLRAIEPEDLDVLYRIENDRELWGVGITNVPYSRFSLHQYVENCTNDIYVDKQLRQMIDNDKGETVGIIDLINYDVRQSRAEVGIVIMSNFRGQGYGRAAMIQLIEYTKKILHLHQLYIISPIYNERCFRLCQSLGFECDIRLKGWVISENGYEDARLMQLFLK